VWRRIGDTRPKKQRTNKQNKRKPMSLVKHYRELDVYQNAMNLAMKVFEQTRHWPSEERFNLTDQIRRSSRSVCTNLAEAWRKRRYKAAFIAKLSRNNAVAIEATVGKGLWAYEKAHQANRRIGSPNSDRVH
jgi:hypothetical protein